MQDTEAPRYEDDIYAWSLDQAEKLRLLQKRVEGHTNGVDFENVIEEVEDLAGQVRRILTGHIRQVVVHMGAIAYTPRLLAIPHLQHWLGEIDAFRINILDTLDEAPGLKGQVEQICAIQWRKSRKATVRKVREVGRLTPTEEQQLKVRIGRETPPNGSEILGFDPQLHKQNSDWDLYDYMDMDTDAPRYPAFVREVLDSIQD